MWICQLVISFGGTATSRVVEFSLRSLGYGMDFLFAINVGTLSVS